MKCGHCGSDINPNPGGITNCKDIKHPKCFFNGGRDPLLNERAKTHGSFEMNARISQDIKKLFHDYGSGSLGPIQREALDMIALKLSRILSGYQLYKDHWDDIAGYAKLGSEACDAKDTRNL